MSGVRPGRIAGTIAVGVVTLIGLSAEGHAQNSDLDVSVRGGMAIPVGNLGKATDLGYGMGAGIAYPLGSGIRLRTDLEFSYFPGQPLDDGSRGADVSQWFVLIGGDLDLAPRSSPWGVRAQVGTGVSLLGTDPLPIPDPITGTSSFRQLDRELFTWHAGFEAHYAVSSTFAPFLRARGLFARAGGSVAAFRGIDDSLGESGWFVSIPLEAGFSLSF